MSDLPGYARAQAQYDAMTPPDDGPSECPECNGSGVSDLVIGDRDDTCQCCDGHGYIDENGEPFNPNAKAEAEEARAEYERDRRRDEGDDA